VDCAPLHAPLAAQAVAFVEDQVSVALEPVLTLVGETLMVAVGNGATVNTADLEMLPPEPVQLRS